MASFSLGLLDEYHRGSDVMLGRVVCVHRFFSLRTLVPLEAFNAAMHTHGDIK